LIKTYSVAIDWTIGNATNISI